VTVLKREVGPVVGGEDRLAFDILNGRMIVERLPKGVNQRDVIDAVQRAGLQARVESKESQEKEPDPGFWQRRRRVLLTSLSGATILAALASRIVIADEISLAELGEGEQPLLAKLFFGVAIISGIWLVLPKAAGAARRLRPDMNLLMTVAVMGAVAIGEW